jgi:hypothetical protein
MDGDLDLVVASNDAGSHFTALIGDKGTFSGISYTATSQPSRQIYNLTTAHLEGMGRFPAVVLTMNSSAIAYFSSGRAFGLETTETAISTLSLRTLRSCGSRGCRLATIQLQQEGFERILLYENSSPTSLYLHQYVTGSGFVDRPIFADLSYFAQEIIVSELNGDRFPDIAISGTDGFVHVYFGNSDPTFTVGPTLGPFPGGVPPAALTSSDFDGDGLVDLAVAGSGSSRIVRYFGRGSGLFFGGEDVNVGDAKLRLQAGDINGDGVSDLLFLDAVSTPSDGKFRALLSNGTRQQSANLFLASGDYRAMFVGDMNGDRLADVVMADAAGRVRSFINTSGATPR